MLMLARSQWSRPSFRRRPRIQLLRHCRQHDWHLGQRIGEAQNPGPAPSLSPAPDSRPGSPSEEESTSDQHQEQGSLVVRGVREYKAYIVLWHRGATGKHVR